MNENKESVKTDAMRLLEHAQGVRQEHTYNAKRARAVAASDWIDSDYAHWNLYRALRGVGISRLVAGEPRAQATLTDRVQRMQSEQQQQYRQQVEEAEVLGIDPATIPPPVDFSRALNAYEDEISVQYGREMISALLRDAQGEAYDAGNSYWYIDPWTWDIQHISYFDVWVDNVKARPNAMEEGRYIFWRCTMDKNLFNQEYEAELKKEGIFPAATGTEELEGREMVGADPSQKMRPLEDVTRQRVVEEFTGQPHVGEGSYNTADDGLVVYYKALLQDDQSESGWTYQIWYNNTVLDEREWPAKIGEPTFYCFATDSISNQFYQPSDYNHVRGYQKTVDAVLARVRDNSRTFGQPPITMTEESYQANNKRVSLGDAEVFLHAPGDEPKFLDLPTVPNQYMQFVEMLVEFARSIELPDVLQGQVDQTDVQSGVAIERLRQEADQRSQMRQNNQEENLRRVGKALCKMVYIRKLDEARAIAAQAYNESAMAQAEELNAAAMAEAAMYNEPMPEPIVPEQVAPEAVNDEKAFQYMPEPFNLITWDMIENDVVFSWAIEPVMTRRDRITALVQSFQATTMVPGVQMDGVAFLKMAGKISGQNRLAEELISAYEEVLPNIQAAEAAKMMQEEAQNAPNEEAANAG